MSTTSWSRARRAPTARLRLVVNASRKAVDFALPPNACPLRLTPLDPALIALQGPAADDPGAARARAGPRDDAVHERQAGAARGFDAFVSRSGYTGEDGYEISLPAAEAEGFARPLLAEPDVAPIGLGARDSLRLEAGLCLYGHELDETIDPVEAALAWSIQKRRRLEGGFPGAERIQEALLRGPSASGSARPGRPRPGARGTEIVATRRRAVGVVTSGGFGPSVGAPIAMGYRRAGTPRSGSRCLIVRGKPLRAGRPLPFHPHPYHRG